MYMCVAIATCYMGVLSSEIWHVYMSMCTTGIHCIITVL